MYKLLLEQNASPRHAFPPPMLCRGQFRLLSIWPEGGPGSDAKPVSTPQS